MMEEEIEKRIDSFLTSEYGRGFIAGMQAATEIISKKIPVPSPEDTGD